MMAYPNSINSLTNAFTEAQTSHANTDYTNLAKRLIEGAKKMDLAKAQNLDLNYRYKGITRNKANPVDYTDDTVKGAPWADDPKNPLPKGEQWNQGRRATNTGLLYDFDDEGMPVNPYMNTGMKGRGCLGQFGPNHAVDNGVIFIKPNEQGEATIYASLGILRKFDDDAPAFAGGFAKFTKDDDGNYIFDRDTVVETQMEEFFEETISGSISLRPEYEAQLDGLLTKEIAVREAERGKDSLSEEDKEELKEQLETGLKLEQVRDLDPGFLERLRDTISKGKECFAGPVLNDNRNTNTSWIETRLSWFVLDDKTWDYIKGTNPKFNYQFSAGDDASGVEVLELSPSLIEKAYASHGSMFAFMAASFLLDAQEKGTVLDASILKQMKEVCDYLETFKPSAPETPEPPPAASL